MSSQQSFVFGVLVTLAVCSAHFNSPYQEMMPQVYCGRTLARAIAALCFEENFEKRSDTGTMYNAILAPYHKEQETQLGWPWLTPHKARGMSLPSRGKRLVVSECCEKACSINELLSYC